MNKYYEIEAYIDGDREVLFGSFDRSDCIGEIDCERESWKEQGYKKIKIVSRQTEDTPDPEIYGDELYQKAICKALADNEITVNVGDRSEDYYDLENSRDIGAIIEAVEATDEPQVTFFKSNKCLGQMAVLVGYGDESIQDHHYNNFMNTICEVE